MKDILAQAVPANRPKPQLPQQEFGHFGNISKHKFAEFYLCNKNGMPIEDSPIVRALCIDGDLSIESQYQTPFENSNPERRLPTLMAALQAGELVDAFGETAQTNTLLGKATSFAVDAAKEFSNATGVNLRNLEGKTNLTKVNTVQVFLSTSSTKVNLTLFFQAYKDAFKEVELQIMQLQAWALPQFLADDSTIQNLNNEGFVDGIFSGRVPPFISVTLSGKTYCPFVIESVSTPLAGPIDKEGNRLNVTVNVSILSRAAWDANDLYALYGNYK